MPLLCITSSSCSTGCQAPSRDAVDSTIAYVTESGVRPAGQQQDRASNVGRSGGMQCGGAADLLYRRWQSGTVFGYQGGGGRFMWYL
jgi:hypothetical protein